MDHKNTCGQTTWLGGTQDEEEADESIIHQSMHLGIISPVFCEAFSVGELFSTITTIKLSSFGAFQTRLAGSLDLERAPV